MIQIISPIITRLVVSKFPRCTCAPCSCITHQWLAQHATRARESKVRVAGPTFLWTSSIDNIIFLLLISDKCFLFPSPIKRWIQRGQNGYTSKIHSFTYTQRIYDRRNKKKKKKENKNTRKIDKGSDLYPGVAKSEYIVCNNLTIFAAIRGRKHLSFWKNG